MKAWEVLRFISWRHLQRARLRSFLTFAAVALGVAMIVGITAANQAVLGAFDELSERAAGKADLEVTSGEAGVEVSLVDELRAQKKLVAHVAPRFEQQSFLKGSGATAGERVLVLGLDFLGDQAFFPYRVSDGVDVIKDPIAFLNDPQAVMIPKDMAKRHDLSLGSELTLRTTEGMKRFHVASLLEETQSTRVFGGQVVVMFLDAAQIAFDRGYLVDRIDIQLRDRETKQQAAEALRHIIGGRGEIAPPSSRAMQLARMTGSFQAAVEVQGILAIVVGMFLVYNAVGVAVSQRKREIGVLRSLGASRRMVAWIFIAEAAVLGLLGAGAGIALGSLIADGVLSLLSGSVSRIYQSISLPVARVSWPLAVLACTAGVFATVVAALVPALRASTTEPVEAMKRDLHQSARAGLPVKALFWVGGGLFVSGLALSQSSILPLAFVGIVLLPLSGALCTPAAVEGLTHGIRLVLARFTGTPLMLGIDNARRDIGRSGLTAAALALTSGMSLTLVVYAHSFEKSTSDWVEHVIPADAWITAGSPLVDQSSVPFSPDWAKEVASVPGVDATTGVRSLSVNAYDLRIEVVGIDSRLYLSRISDGSFQRVLDGPSPLPADSLAGEPAVLVSENFSRRTGILAGGVVELPSPTGIHRFKVVAVVIDYSSDQGWMLMDGKYLHDYWRDPRIEAFEVFVARGYDVEQVTAAIRERLRGQDNGLFIMKGGEIKAEIMHLVRQTLNVSKASEVISLVIALLGIVGTMVAAVVDRTRELGVLRAIGASEGQIVWSVVSEAAWLSVCGVIMAILMAIPVAILFLDIVGPRATGWSIPLALPDVEALRVVTLVVLTGGLAGMLPGWRASRVNVTGALLHE